MPPGGRAHTVSPVSRLAYQTFPLAVSSHNMKALLRAAATFCAPCKTVPPSTTSSSLVRLGPWPFRTTAASAPGLPRRVAYAKAAAAPMAIATEHPTAMPTTDAPAPEAAVPPPPPATAASPFEDGDALAAGDLAGDAEPAGGVVAGVAVGVGRAVRVFDGVTVGVPVGVGDGDGVGAMQTVPPAGDDVPAGHAVHEVLAAAEIVFAAHATHEEVPLTVSA